MNILEKLCTNDHRNPDGVISFADDLEDYPDSKSLDPNCYCDNCFYGRTKLALYILSLNPPEMTDEYIEQQCEIDRLTNRSDISEFTDKEIFDEHDRRLLILYANPYRIKCIEEIRAEYGVFS
jgi:hypothetical protein